MRQEPSTAHRENRFLTEQWQWVRIERGPGSRKLRKSLSDKWKRMEPATRIERATCGL